MKDLDRLAFNVLTLFKFTLIKKFKAHSYLQFIRLVPATPATGSLGRSFAYPGDTLLNTSFYYVITGSPELR